MLDKVAEFYSTRLIKPLQCTTKNGFVKTESAMYSIEATGRFINEGSAEDNYFSTTAQGASSYAKQAA